MLSALAITTFMLTSDEAAQSTPPPATPRPTLRQFSQPGVGYSHFVVVPGLSELSRNELDRWLDILAASEGQAATIRAMYDDYMTEQHAPLMRRGMPAYLAKAAIYAETGMPRRENFDQARDAQKAVYESASELIESATRLELQFIDSFEPILTPEQIEVLPVLRAHTARRKARSASTADRRVKFELREVWGPYASGLPDESGRGRLAARIAEYERDLTVLLEQWLKAMYHGAWEMHRYRYDAARDLPSAASFRPQQAWAPRADLVGRIRALHQRVHDELCALAGDDIASKARHAFNARMFSEVYPDNAGSQVRACFTEAMRNAPAPGDDVLPALLQVFDERYAAVSARLEAACTELWDSIATGVGRANGQDLPGILQPLLEEREALCQAFLARCNTETGGGSAAGDPPQARQQAQGSAGK